MVISHFLPFATVPVIHSESMPLKLTQTPKEELRPILTNLGTAMRAKFLENRNFILDFLIQSEKRREREREREIKF